MKSILAILMLAVVAGPTDSFPDLNALFSEQRDENGYISIKDLGELLGGMCGQLGTFKDTLAGPVSAGYGDAILKSPLPLPNLAALDFSGMITLLTQGLGMALDKTTEIIGAGGIIPTPGTDVATTGTTDKPGFLLTIGDVLEMAEYLCKVVNLVAAVLNNKLFDFLHINRITIPLNDPTHPIPDMSWYEKLDILNLRGLGQGLINVGGALFKGISCLFGCSEPTTAAPGTVPEELKKPEKPSIFDDLSSFYGDKKK